MGRPGRKIIAVNVETGEKREFASAYECAMALGTGHCNALAALDRNGVCFGWKLYDSPESLRKRIEELQRQLAEIEG
jgi:hypothetical protein